MTETKVDACFHSHPNAWPTPKARGMTEIAKTTGIKREALYKALRPNAQPRLDTIARVCKALGVKLTIAV